MRCSDSSAGSDLRNARSSFVTRGKKCSDFALDMRSHSPRIQSELRVAHNRCARFWESLHFVRVKRRCSPLKEKEELLRQHVMASYDCELSCERIAA